jgi:adenosylhomocysteinase
MPLSPQGTRFFFSAMSSAIEQELDLDSPAHATFAARANQLPEMNNVRLACSVHLEIKMIPLFEALLARGAQLFLTTCNPNTVRLEVVNWLVKNGARAEAWYGMPPAASVAACNARSTGSRHIFARWARI